MTISEREVIAAYAKLREFTKESAPPTANLSEIEAQIKILYEFKEQDSKQRQNLEEHAEMALAEGHVEVFETVCDWCRLDSVQDVSELAPYTTCFRRLYLMLNYRCCNSARLATRLANSNHYMRAEALDLLWDQNDDSHLVVGIRNILNHLIVAPVAVNAFRKLYAQILALYKSKINEEIRVSAVMILSLLSTESEAKDLSDEALEQLVGYLGKCVRKELPTPRNMWVDERCTRIIRTLEKMITSDVHIVEKLLKLNLLTFLRLVLEESFSLTKSQRADELSASLTCLWSLSQDADALSHIAGDAQLVKAIERYSMDSDEKTSAPAKKILEAIKDATAESKNRSQAVASTSRAAIDAKSISGAEATSPEVTAASHSAAAQTSASKHPAAISIGPITKLRANADLTSQILARAGDKSTPVFISYQSAFVERVALLKYAVEARGIPCWMATDDMVGNVQDAIGEALAVASAIIICYSHSYRESIYCKAEANSAFRSEIPMVACCVEEGYEADYWLAVVTSAAPGLDCSTDAKLAACLDRLEKELRAARRVLKPHALSASKMKGVVFKSPAHADGPAAIKSVSISSTKSFSTSEGKQSYAAWDTNQAAIWLKSLSLYDSVPEENRVQIDGAFLKEMRTLKHDVPTEFVKCLSDIFHFDSLKTIKFRAELEKLD